MLARVLAEGMAKVLKGRIVVENRPGADQTIGFEVVAKKSPADGYSVGLFGLDSQALMSLTKTTTLRFDPLNDLTLVAGLGSARFVLVGPSGVAYKNFREFAQAIKAAPGKFSYGSSALPMRVPTILLMRDLGLVMRHIPYSASAPAMAAVVGATVDWAVFAEGSTNAVKKRVRLYGITGKTRSALYPDVPTFSELGFSGIVGPTYALMVRRGTPQAIVDKLASAASVVMATPEMQAAARSFQFEMRFQRAQVAGETLHERYGFYQDLMAKGVLQVD
jgi:tripartite-type tricarboxylate transporter receptor subunit TctC